MAYTSMTITSVSGGSITSADTDLTLSGQVTIDHRNAHDARTVTVQASSNGGTTWTNVGSFGLAAWDPPGSGSGTFSQAWSGTITSLPAAFTNVNDVNYVFRTTMPSGFSGTSSSTITSSTSAAVPVDTAADSDVVVDLTDASTTANSASVAFNLNNLDAGSTATVTFTGAGGGTSTVAYTTGGAKTADVSGLQGAVTAAVSVTDDAGNVAAGQGETLAGDPVCFYPGTLVHTPAGEVAVETLCAGDLVLTADGRAAPVRWLGRQTVSTRFADPLRVLPIRITAGALGEALPKRDLLVSSDHALLVDGALLQAGALVNGTTVRREKNVPEVFTYWHVELADHALILAEGVPAETFVDNVDRLAFDNWDEHETAGAEAPIAEMALPRAKSARQVPAATRRRLAARAAAVSGAAMVAA